MMRPMPPASILPAAPGEPSLGDRPNLLLVWLAAAAVVVLGCHTPGSSVSEAGGRDGARATEPQPPSREPGRGNRPARTAGPRALAGLQAHCVGGTDGACGGTGPAVVLLHGYGAPGDDLVGLSARLAFGSSDVRFFFPEAVLDLGGRRRAWWRLRVSTLQHRFREGARSLPETPPGLPEARARMLAFLRTLDKELAAPPSRIVLGGFSQGAMLALDVMLRTPEPLAGVALLSGALVAADASRARFGSRRGQRVFISHGRDDSVLPFFLGEHVRDQLRSSEVAVEWVPFDGGHEIPPRVVASLSSFIRRALDVRAAEPRTPASR